MDSKVTVGAVGGVDVCGYSALTAAISPAESADLCPMAMPAGIVSIVGCPFLENEFAG